MADLAVCVASHKPYWVPEDAAYVPVWVGAALNDPPHLDGWSRDDSGKHISERNRNYCELTALYWAWHNLDASYLGLVHYRRHFARGPFGAPRMRVARTDDLLRHLRKAPVILPAQRHYRIETNYSQYVHAHHEVDLLSTRSIISRRCPEYLSAYDASMARTHGHRFNMLVMREDLFRSYAQWLFGILFELEQALDLSDYSQNDARVFGFVAERLLDPWIETNSVPYVELGVSNLERQHWPRKAASFLLRKIRADQTAGNGLRRE